MMPIPWAFKLPDHLEKNLGLLLAKAAVGSSIIMISGTFRQGNGDLEHLLLSDAEIFYFGPGRRSGN